MRERLLRGWPLTAILTAQAVLTLPWLWRTAPFTDEALYLLAGNREWAHWLHHARSPDYASWFSGSPVLYPPLGAAADSAGGLVGARCLSLLLMLGATTMVYLASSRLFDRQAAFFAAGMFSVSGLVIHNGAFATYNPLALFLLALSAWAATLVRDGKPVPMAACIGALVMSNAAKYATLAWDPIVAGIVVIHSYERGTAKALSRGIALVASVVALESILLVAAGAQYVSGLEVTTIFRTVQGNFGSPAAVLWRAFAMTGVFVLPAILGMILSIRKHVLTVTFMLSSLTIAAFIAPLDQARIHELSSLDKNMSFGLPFVAIAAGYAVSECIAWAERRFTNGKAVGIVAGAALILGALVLGRTESVQFRGLSLPVASQIVTAIRQSYYPGSYILTDSAPWMEKYYLSGIPARAWTGIFNPSAVQRTRIEDRICTGRVSLTILRLVDGSYVRSEDYAIYSAMEDSKVYKLAVSAGQGDFTTQVWQNIQKASHEQDDGPRVQHRCPELPGEHRSVRRRVVQFRKAWLTPHRGGRSKSWFTHKR